MHKRALVSVLFSKYLTIQLFERLFCVALSFYVVLVLFSCQPVLAQTTTTCRPDAFGTAVICDTQPNQIFSVPAPSPLYSPQGYLSKDHFGLHSLNPSDTDDYARDENLREQTLLLREQRLQLQAQRQRAEYISSLAAELNKNTDAMLHDSECSQVKRRG